MVAERRLLLTILTVAALVGAGGDDGSAGSATSSTATTAAPTTTSTTAPPEPVEGLLATVAPNRLYATRHAFGLGIRNVGDAPVEVVTAFLDSGLFEPAEAGDEGVVLQPGGRRFVLPVPYGEPICDGAVDVHVAVVTLADGREVRVPAVEEFPGAVARLHARECAALAVLDRAELAFGDQWAQDGTTIHGELLLEERTPGEPVTVEDLRGNVIFTLSADRDDGPILAIDEDDPAAAVPVTISADRCDPHAVAEFKTPFLMLAWVSVGSGEPVAVELEATGPARTALEELIATCSTG